MKYLKLYNKFTESVTIGHEPTDRNILEGDNFSLSKNLKFPEIEDLDMYLQLIEDDGYSYDVGEFVSKEEVSNSKDMPYTDDKLKFGIHDICNYKYIKVISVELPRYYNLNEIDFLQEFKRKYFKSDKFDMRIDNVEGILKIKIIPKEIIDVKEIIKKFNTDVEKFLNDNKEILTGEIEFLTWKTIHSFGFSVVINNCVVSDLNNLKNKLEDFLDSYDYYVGVILNRSRRMTFTISIDLVDSSE